MLGEIKNTFFCDMPIIIDQNKFSEAKTFIYSDIEREIQLARASKNCYNKVTLQKMGINPGGGNFLAALGLMCYTEFAGKLMNDGKCDPSQDFNGFFDQLGKQYKIFRHKRKIYGSFRCGLAHEYYVKRSCTIYMLKGIEKIGISQDNKGHYHFSVETYFNHFREAFDRLEKNIFHIA